MSSYLVYICQAVKNRAGLERYWQVARYPENISDSGAIPALESHLKANRQGAKAPRS